MENEITQLMQETRQEVASDTFWDSEIEKANLDTNSIKLLGQANMLYTQGNSVDSIKLLLTIIKANPNAPEPWLTLALNHDSNKSHRKAFGAYLIAAHLTRDPQLWKRLSLISQNDNNYPQAIYCLNKCVTCDPSDVDAIWDLAYLCYHEKRYQKAIDLYLNILQLAPFDITVTMEVVKIYKKLNHFKEAVTLLEVLLFNLECNGG